MKSSISVKERKGVRASTNINLISQRERLLPREGLQSHRLQFRALGLKIGSIVHNEAN